MSETKFLPFSEKGETADVIGHNPTGEVPTTALRDLTALARRTDLVIFSGFINLKNLAGDIANMASERLADIRTIAGNSGSKSQPHR